MVTLTLQSQLLQTVVAQVGTQARQFGLEDPMRTVLLVGVAFLLLVSFALMRCALRPLKEVVISIAAAALATILILAALAFIVIAL